MLSDDLREELAIAPATDCDRLAELSGLYHVAGRAHLRGRGIVDGGGGYHAERHAADSDHVDKYGAAECPAAEWHEAVRRNDGHRLTTARSRVSTQRRLPEP